MTLTPAVKGQLTKAVRTKAVDNQPHGPAMTFVLVRAIFLKHMPREQAKHATRKYLAQVVR